MIDYTPEPELDREAIIAALDELLDWMSVHPKTRSN